MAEHIATILKEIPLKANFNFNNGNIGKKEMVENKKRQNMAVVASVYCPIILALVHEIPQLTIAKMRRILKKLSLCNLIYSHQTI